MASLYVHVPFCQRKCPYCDFYSVEESVQIDRYVRALGTEAALLSGRYGSRPIATLYVGGGTPSLLPEAAFEEMMTSLRTAFRLSPGCEMTVEVNPGTATVEKFRLYRALGINRISIGIQSFHQEELAFLGRIHTVSEAEECFTAARRAGFGNISVDLIYSVPGQSIGAWEHSLRRAVALGAEHISAYSLIVESGTPFSLMVKQGQWSPNPDELEATLFERTMEILEQEGYEHYEVSNYARPGLRSKHNSAYWSHQDYLGLGPSAHSFVLDGAGTPLRWWNVAALRPYLEHLEGGNLPVASREYLDRTTLDNERVLLGLRSDGVDLDFLHTMEEAGSGRAELVHDLVERGLAVVSSGRLRLTTGGFVLCDEIARRFMIG